MNDLFSIIERNTLSNGCCAVFGRREMEKSRSERFPVFTVLLDVSVFFLQTPLNCPWESKRHMHGTRFRRAVMFVILKFVWLIRANNEMQVFCLLLSLLAQMQAVLRVGIFFRNQSQEVYVGTEWQLRHASMNVGSAYRAVVSAGFVFARLILAKSC